MLPVASELTVPVNVLKLITHWPTHHTDLQTILLLAAWSHTRFSQWKFLNFCIPFSTTFPAFFRTKAWRFQVSNSRAFPVCTNSGFSMYNATWRTRFKRLLSIVSDGLETEHTNNTTQKWPWLTAQQKHSKNLGWETGQSLVAFYNIRTANGEGLFFNPGARTGWWTAENILPTMTVHCATFDFYSQMVQTGWQ